MRELNRPMIEKLISEINSQNVMRQTLYEFDETETSSMSRIVAMLDSIIREMSDAYNLGVNPGARAFAVNSLASKVVRCLQKGAQIKFNEEDKSVSIGVDADSLKTRASISLENDGSIQVIATGRGLRQDVGGVFNLKGNRVFGESYPSQTGIAFNISFDQEGIWTTKTEIYKMSQKVSDMLGFYSRGLTVENTKTRIEPLACREVKTIKLDFKDIHSEESVVEIDDEYSIVVPSISWVNRNGLGSDTDNLFDDELGIVYPKQLAAARELLDAIGKPRGQ